VSCNLRLVEVMLQCSDFFIFVMKGLPNTCRIHALLRVGCVGFVRSRHNNSSRALLKK
jgi:hypothetical protein